MNTNILSQEALELLTSEAPPYAIWAIAGIFIFGFVLLFTLGNKDWLVNAAGVVMLVMLGITWFQYMQYDNRVAEAREEVSAYLLEEYGYKLSDSQAESQLNALSSGEATIRPTTADGSIRTVLLRVVDGELKAFTEDDDSTWTLVESADRAAEAN